MAKKVRREFTDAAPQVLPASSLSPAQYQDASERLKEFSAAIRNGKSASPLELSADELNAFIERNPELISLRGKVHVLLEGNQARAQLSMPMGEIGLPVFRDRYLNGLADFHVGLRDGSLKLAATNILVRGKPLPNIYQAQIREQNLAGLLKESTNASAVLGKLDSIQVTNSKVRISPKAPNP